MSGFIYLASPYSSTDRQLRHSRYKRAVHATKELASRGEIVFCPVVYGHSFELAARREFPYDYWLRWSLSILAGASKLYVLTILGWANSKGVRAEVTLAHQLNIPIIGYQADENCEDVSGFDIIGTFGLSPHRLPTIIEPVIDNQED